MELPDQSIWAIADAIRLNPDAKDFVDPILEMHLTDRRYDERTTLLALGRIADVFGVEI